MKYIYKIHTPTPDDPPFPLSPSTATTKPTLPPSPLDISSQYIHLSTAAQIPATLSRFFASAPTRHAAVILLRIPLAPLKALGEDVVRWESPDGRRSNGGEEAGEGFFPHVYFADGRLGLSGEEIEGAVEVESRVGEEGWEHGLKRLEVGWLV